MKPRFKAWACKHLGLIDPHNLVITVARKKQGLQLGTTLDRMMLLQKVKTGQPFPITLSLQKRSYISLDLEKTKGAKPKGAKQ